MKHLYRHVFFQLLFPLFFFILCHAEGFGPGTLIKVPDGYKRIENLCVGDHVISHDPAKNTVISRISHTAKKSINSYIRIHVADGCICAANDQQLYDEEHGAWITAGSLKTGDISAGHTITIDMINATIDVYLITVEEYHTFFVSRLNICAHNFAPVFVGISLLFGGGLELAGISCGIAGLGTYLGYQWHKKSKRKHDIVIQPQFYSGGMMPEDPEEKKKRKRDVAREEYKSLTNKEAKDLAEKMGFKLDKNPPFDSYGKAVFRKGRVYISADRTGHKGGVWKVFRKGEGRCGTWNIDLTQMIGE